MYNTFKDWLNKLASGKTGATVTSQPSGSTYSSTPNANTYASQGLTVQGPNTAYTGVNSMTNQANYLNAAKTPTFSTVSPVGTQDTTQNNYSYGSGGGGSSYDPLAAQKAQEDAQKNSTFESVKSKLASLRSVFDGLFSSIDDVVKEKTSDYQKQQGNALDDLTKQYLQTDNQTRSIMGARGLSDSSYLGDALGQNNQVYNRSFDDLGSQYTKNLAAIGQWASGQKANFNNQYANAQQYVDTLGQNIGDLGLADLTSADQNIGGLVGSAQAGAANYRTTPQNFAELQKISPVTTQGTAQLASRLQALVTSSAPAFAKRQIAMGLVNASGLQDENAKGYWNSQFEDMLKKAGQA